MPAAQQELRRLSDETGMFGSITDEAIAANAGKTYQDVTAMRDPLAGLTENLTGMEFLLRTPRYSISTPATTPPTDALQAAAGAVK